MAAAARGRGILTHCDAAQSAGKVAVKVNALGVDLLTLVAHKFGGPKGVAALYVRSGTALQPLLRGGGQEGGRRAGTESVLHIVGMGAAAQLAEAEAGATAAHMAALRGRLQAGLEDELGGPDGLGVRVHGPADAARRLPNTLSIGLRGISASALLQACAARAPCAGGFLHIRPL